MQTPQKDTCISFLMAMSGAICATRTILCHVGMHSLNLMCPCGKLLIRMRWNHYVIIMCGTSFLTTKFLPVERSFHQNQSSITNVTLMKKLSGIKYTSSQRVLLKTWHRLHRHICSCCVDVIYPSYPAHWCIPWLGDSPDGCQDSFSTWWSWRGVYMEQPKGMK